jgi:predicted ATPase
MIKVIDTNIIETNISAYVTCFSESSPSKEQCQRRYIITGAPGVGKTSIINHLNQLGQGVFHEAATEVISQELVQGVEKPWEKEGFREKLVTLHEKHQQEALALKTSVVFFDRSPVDTLSFCLRLNAIPTNILRTCVQTMIDTGYYERTVFLIESLNLYEQTPIRSESKEESLIMEKHLEYNYKTLGFKVIRIPKDSIEARTQRILAYVYSDTIKR